MDFAQRSGFLILAQRASLPVCVSLMDMGVHQPKGGLLRYEFTPSFRPHTQQPSGLGKGPRRWLRVKRIFAMGD